jgi:hypothetical protein
MIVEELTQRWIERHEVACLHRWLTFVEDRIEFGAGGVLAQMARTRARDIDIFFAGGEEKGRARLAARRGWANSTIRNCAPIGSFSSTICSSSAIFPRAISSKSSISKRRPRTRGGESERAASRGAPHHEGKIG